MGDIVLLKLAVKSPVHYKGFLSADGVISSTLEVIPRESQVETGANVITRSCLFRVENARRATKKTFAKAESELKLASGKPLTYGERVQLRHLHSLCFVSVDSQNIAQEGGCLSVLMSKEESAAS